MRVILTVFLKSGTSGKELEKGEDKWHPWLATHLEAPELRLWLLSSSRRRKRISSLCPSFPSFTAVALETGTSPRVRVLLEQHHLLSEPD